MAKAKIPDDRVGKKAPAFSLPDSHGGKTSLSSLRGKRVVLYFYPKDDTPGCTVEAKEFRDLGTAFKKAGAVVLGISPDSVASHCRFREKHGLDFALLSDEDHRVCDAYSVWVEKNMYGRRYWGVQRSTFVIDEKGVIRAAWPKVKPLGHGQEVLTALGELGD